MLVRKKHQEQKHHIKDKLQKSVKLTNVDGSFTLQIVKEINGTAV